MRILHLVHQFPPEHIGGTELYTQMLARHQALQGHEVSLFYPSEAAGRAGALRERLEAGVRLFAAPVAERTRTGVFLSTWRHQALAESFAETLSRTQPELVHVQHMMGLPASIVAQVQAAGIPHIVSLHDYWYVCANAQLLTNYSNEICAGPKLWVNCGRCALARAGVGPAALLSPAVAPLMAHRAARIAPLLREAAALIAPTHFVRDIYGQLGVDTAAIRVIPHGIDVPAFVARAGRPGGPRQAERLHAVYVGSIAWQKGVHVLVEAANRLADEEIAVTIFGDLGVEPDYADGLRRSAGHPGLTFAGAIAREDLWRMLLDEADVLVVPSVWYETAALVVQEAFAAGVPVVASHLGALQERVRDNVDGLLFTAGDAAALGEVLLRLKNTPALLRQLQAGIRPVRLIADHTAEVMAVYEQIRAAR